MRKRDTKEYRGIGTIEATRTIIANVAVYNYIASIDVFIKIADAIYQRFVSNYIYSCYYKNLHRNLCDQDKRENKKQM